MLKINYVSVPQSQNVRNIIKSVIAPALETIRNILFRRENEENTLVDDDLTQMRRLLHILNAVCKLSAEIIMEKHGIWFSSFIASVARTEPFDSHNMIGNKLEELCIYLQNNFHENNIIRASITEDIFGTNIHKEINEILTTD